MLSVKLFNAGLKTLTREELREVVEVVNRYIEEKSIVITGVASVDAKGKPVLEEFSTKPETWHEHTALAFDVTYMGSDEWNNDKKSVTRDFFNLNVDQESDAYFDRQKFREMEKKLEQYEKQEGDDGSV